MRDPADRLLSGFLNKCAGEEWDNCPYIEFMPKRFPGVSQRDHHTDVVSVKMLAFGRQEVQTRKCGARKATVEIVDDL